MRLSQSRGPARTDAINLSAVRMVDLHGGDFLNTFRQARLPSHEGGDFPGLVPPSRLPQCTEHSHQADVRVATDGYQQDSLESCTAVVLRRKPLVGATWTAARNTRGSQRFQA